MLAAPTRTRFFEPKREVLPSIENRTMVVDPVEQIKSPEHGAPIPESYIKHIFGKEFIDTMKLLVKSGKGNAAYIKGGRISQLVNRPFFQVEEYEDKAPLGDIDILITGKETLASIIDEFPQNKGKHRIAQIDLTDGQEVDMANGERFIKEASDLTQDVLAQVSKMNRLQRLFMTPKQRKVLNNALLIAEKLQDDPESIMIGTSLNSAKAAAIKVEVDENGELKFSVCDPRGTIKDEDNLDRSFLGRGGGTLFDMWFSKGWGIDKRSIGNASGLSIYKFVIDTVNEFGHINSDSKILWGAVPIALRVITSDLEEKMPLQVDSLLGEHSARFGSLRKETQITRGRDTLSSVRKFLAKVIKEPNFANIPDSQIRPKPEYSNFGEYNMFRMKKALLGSLEKDARGTLFYMFSYIPELGKTLLPSIDQLPALQKYHEVFDKVVQNALEDYIFWPDIFGESSRIYRENVEKLGFFRNLKHMADQVFPHTWQVLVKKSTGWAQSIERQQKPTTSLSRVIALLLISAGQSNPTEDLLDSLAEDAGSLTLNGSSITVPPIMICIVSPESIRREISAIYEMGIEPIE